MYLLRKLIYIAGLAALLVSQPGYALGLGESELHSALNQPLRADIELTNVRGLDANDIIVRLASNADFERAGLERLEFYGQLEFELMVDNEPDPIVRVTTERPVREPYLNFLVEARWDSGRLLREYTFLLDLPTFDDEQTQPVEAAPAVDRTEPAADSGRRSRTEPARESSAEWESRADAAGTSSDTYGPVSDRDTLWEIALQVRPHSDVSVQQTMLAIQRKNPEAFINGNINLLRKGQVLRLPDRNEIQGLPSQQAVSEVADHNRQWSETTLGAQLDAGRRTGSAPSDAGEVNGQVRLAAPNQSGSEDDGQGGGDSTERGTELESELASTQEELDRTRRENRELSARVEELEEQIGTMQSLIEASNEQLRALQASVQQSREETGSGAEVDTSGAMDNSSDAASQNEVAGEPATEARPAASTEAQQSREATVQEDRGRRVLGSTPEPKTLVDHLLENVLWIAAGALVIMLGIYYALRRRAQSGEVAAAHEAREEFESDFDAEEFTASQEGVETAEDELQDADWLRESGSDAEPGDWNSGDAPGVEAQTDDLVGEADIYIAYGKPDQAEELLLKGLERDPASPDILSRLLDVYAENRDQAAFDKTYASLLATDNRAAIQRAQALRETIPGAGEFDLDTREDEARDAATNESRPEDRTESPMDFSDLDEEPSDDLEFSLDLDQDLSESDSDDTAQRASGDEALSLVKDFRFDLDDEGSELEKPQNEKDLELSASRYDLSFEENAQGADDLGAQDDDFNLDFDIEDDSAVAKDATADMGEHSEGGEEFPELDLTLDADDESNLENDSSIGETADDDWSFDFETSDPETADLDKLDEELSTLDDDTSDVGEPERDSDEELTLAWDAPLADQEPAAEPDGEHANDRGETTRATADVVQVSLENDSEPDFNVDDMDMDDVDWTSLDQEISDLDADLDETQASGERSSSTETAPASEAESEEWAMASDTSEAGSDEDAMFEEALSGFSPEESGPRPVDDFDDSELSEEDMESELDFLADSDEAGTKLDLARAYIDMGDADGARDILEEVSQEGDDEQKHEASELLSRI